MRFPRQSAIFRGPLDPAAVISVLFLLVIFLLVGSLSYTPGVLVEGPGPAESQTITITRDNDILFAGKTNRVGNLTTLLDDLKNPTNHPPFRLLVESGASSEAANAVRRLFQVELPSNSIVNLTGTDNPTIRVKVNFLGQCFFENRPISERELKDQLRARLQEMTGGHETLTMVLEADKATQYDVIMRVCRAARDAGITEVLLAEWPNPLGVAPRQFPP